MHAIKDKNRFVLATDLDGTFLGGSADERDSLYKWLEQHRDEFVLIFVSGRGQGFMRKLAHSLPIRPDVCIGDVGTSVHLGPELMPLPDLEDWIDSAWRPDASIILASTLQTCAQLCPQQHCGGRRLSYTFKDLNSAYRAALMIRAHGFDVLISDQHFLDVLPRGVQKGSTLLRTLNHLELSLHKTFVAGDTLNDLSMFESGLTGVVVHNSESALKQALVDRENVYFSAANGAAGVLEGLKRFYYAKGDDK